jgi:hypothetical protein
MLNTVNCLASSRSESSRFAYSKGKELPNFTQTFVPWFGGTLITTADFIRRLSKEKKSRRHCSLTTGYHHGYLIRLLPHLYVTHQSLHISFSAESHNTYGKDPASIGENMASTLREQPGIGSDAGDAGYAHVVQNIRTATRNASYCHVA